MEWKRNGNKNRKLSGNKIIGNGTELERKWNGKYFTKETIQWNGNGMEMERKWNGKKCEKPNGKEINRNGMEKEWKWNGK